MSEQERQPEAVQALDAAIERGHHVALIASEGAGLGQLYARVAVHDLVGEGPGPGAGLCLVLAASTERATRLARAMQPACSAGGLEVGLMGFEGSGVAATESGARIFVGTPGIVLGEVRAGRLGLDDVRTFVLDDVKGLGDAWDAVEGLLQTGGEETRRVAVTRASDKRFEELIDRRMPRARRWPAELFDAADGGPSGPVVSVGAAPTRDARLWRLAELMHEIAAEGDVDRVVVWAADATARDRIRAALAVEGFRIAEEGEAAGIRIRILEPGATHDGRGAAVLCGLPRDPDELAAALESADVRYAIVDTRHEAQLGILLARRSWRARHMGDPPEPEILDDVDRFRDEVEAAIETQDLAAGTLLLGPLLETHGAGRVAAALAAIVRARSSTETGEGAADVPAQRAARPVWTRLFVGVGDRDGARPGDLVGAIVGETGAAAGQIGKIDIRSNFALVDVDSQVADQIIRGLAGVRIKGRDVVVKRDRAAK